MDIGHFAKKGDEVPPLYHPLPNLVILTITSFLKRIKINSTYSKSELYITDLCLATFGSQGTRGDSKM